MDESTNDSALGFEATFWATADKLRGNPDAECEHVVLGLNSLANASAGRRARRKIEDAS